MLFLIIDELQRLHMFGPDHMLELGEIEDIPRLLLVDKATKDYEILFTEDMACEDGEKVTALKMQDHMYNFLIGDIQGPRGAEKGIVLPIPILERIAKEAKSCVEKVNKGDTDTVIDAINTIFKDLDLKKFEDKEE